jgi:hypothetical protein
MAGQSPKALVATVLLTKSSDPRDPYLTHKVLR